MKQLVQISRIKHLLDMKTLLLLINSFVFYFIVPQCGGTHQNESTQNAVGSKFCYQSRIRFKEL